MRRNYWQHRSFSNSFTWTVPWRVIDDEPEVEVFYTFTPEEPQIIDYKRDIFDPGCPEDIDVWQIRGVSRRITKREHRLIAECMSEMEEAAFESVDNLIEFRMEAYG